MARFLAVMAVLVLPAALCCSTASADPSVNQQQILQRYRNDIWPATAAYNGDHWQGGLASRQFWDVVDPTLLAADQSIVSFNAYTALRSAAQGLGLQGEYDRATQTSHSNDGLQLADVGVVGVSEAGVTLRVCYTYTQYWYVNVADTRQAPGASDVLVGVVDRDGTWFLHSMTSDRVVPSCPSSP